MRTKRPMGRAVSVLVATALWLCCGPVGADERVERPGRGCIAAGRGDRVVPAVCWTGRSAAAGNVRAVLAKARKGSAPAGGHDWQMVEFCLASAARADSP